MPEGSLQTVPAKATEPAQPGIPAAQKADVTALTRWRRVIFGRNPRATFTRVVVFSAVVLLLHQFAFRPVRVDGISMEPTYHDRSLNLINRLAYKISKPKQGDVVLISYAAGDVNLIKRIIGLPGETVRIENGYVMINGRPLQEPYVKFRKHWVVQETKLGPSEYFVVGDNRGMDKEGHTMGVIDGWHIKGKAMF